MASQSIATQSMASHSGAEHNTAQHVMAWRGVPWRVSGSSSRGLGRSGVAAPRPALWAPWKAPHEAGLMESTRWLCFQHRLLNAETGLPLDTSSKRRRPKVGGGPLRPKNQRIDTGCVITSDGVFGESISRFGAYSEGPKTPALQRVRDSEGAEARK